MASTISVSVTIRGTKEYKDKILFEKDDPYSEYVKVTIGDRSVTTCASRIIKALECCCPDMRKGE